MRDSSPAAAPMLLSPALQHYAWGDRKFIPQLLGLGSSSEPCAEAWFGAHPQASARARLEGMEQPLDALARAQPTWFLAQGSEARIGEMPYLLKLLAAEKPLSIQVHPNQAQAMAGFAREENAGIARDAAQRCYRDRNHKPELIVALTPFYALCGFRPPEQIAALMRELPELQALLPPFRPDAAGVRVLLESYFALPEAHLEPALRQVIARLEEQNAGTLLSETESAYWVLQAHRTLATNGHVDRGLLFVFLLELVLLEPGQALFLPAGVPHAYLHGAGVELMANSDNVLRAGLTPKHVDVEELLQVVRFDARRPPILEPVVDFRGVEARYPVPVADFELNLVLPDAKTRSTFTAHGPETLLALADSRDSRVLIHWAGGRLELRSGQACLIPHGLAYSVESEQAAGIQLYRARVPGGDGTPKFRGRSPTALSFGTSGLRGLVSDITDLEAYVNTRGFVDFLVASGDAVPGTTLAIAGDLRPSTERILKAVVGAVQDSGLAVKYCGCIPTPALTHYGLQHGCPSIMVTGSHIPFDRNGIKFNKSGGEVLKADEPSILEAVARVRRLEYERSPESSVFDEAGNFRTGSAPELSEPDDEARSLYVRRYVETFPPQALAGLRVAFYEHSAVGRGLITEILRELGAEVHPVGRSERFVAIDTEAIEDAQLRKLQELADDVQAKVGTLDAIVSTDGDSDRPLLLGIDTTGAVRFVPGDVLGTIVAEHLKASAIAVPVSSSDLIDRHFAARGVPVARTRIGSPWVIAALSELQGERVVGWEANGGFMTWSPLGLGREPLAALPTRDAVLPLVAALHAAAQRRQTLVQLIAELPARFSRSGLLDGVAPDSSRALLDSFGVGDPAVLRVHRGGQTFSWTDPGGQSQVAEAALERRCAEVFDRLGQHFNAQRGFDQLVEVDYLDGLRLQFVNGDVAHVRPSGNAPQLRIYAVADREARARQIVQLALAEPNGILRELLSKADEQRFVSCILANIQGTRRLFEAGEPAKVIGTVSGSERARTFWQQQLDRALPIFCADKAISLHEDLPVNQAFGLLLMWQRLKEHILPGKGILMAFVFGEGSRATPFTETECGQKPALSSFVAVGSGANGRYLSIVELALRYFAPVEAYLRRSGFDGVVVKWGDEVQIPTLNLAGSDPLFASADVVRFVSLRAITPDDAANKDWVGVDASGVVTAFIPRRPLSEMEKLADRGLLLRKGGRLYGGINLGSIALSRALLDVLLEEFGAEVNDPRASRTERPDLDPQLFTALTIAAIESSEAREAAWDQARREAPAIEKLDRMLPRVLERLRRVFATFEQRYQRKIRMVALDFDDQYWGDVGQHRQMYELYMALGASGPAGEIARALAGLGEAARDERGNLLIGNIRLGPDVRVRNSVLINAQIDSGSIEDSVLVGTSVGLLRARQAFDLQSTAVELTLEPRSGSYKLVSATPVTAGPGDRVTTVFLADHELLMRVNEATDLRDRDSTYAVPILGNAISFQEAHLRVSEADPVALEARRSAKRREVQARLSAEKG